MKIAKKKPVKEVVKAKIAKVKDKVKSIKDKVKGVAAVAVLCGFLAALAGCSFDTTPASRATTATVTVEVRNYGGTNYVSNSRRDCGVTLYARTHRRRTDRSP